MSYTVVCFLRWRHREHHVISDKSTKYVNSTFKHPSFLKQLVWILPTTYAVFGPTCTYSNKDLTFGRSINRTTMDTNGKPKSQHRLQKYVHTCCRCNRGRSTNSVACRVGDGSQFISKIHIIDNLINICVCGQRFLT